MKPPTILIIHHTADTDEMQAESVQDEHAAKGYPVSSLGSNVCYHFMIEKDGTMKQFRSLYERNGCTRNTVANSEAIQIVVAGNFQIEEPTPVQLAALERLIRQLDTVYHFKEISGHEEYSPTACPGINLINDLKRDGLWRVPPDTRIFKVTRYYTPEPGQKVYYHGSYEKDFSINCSGNCLSPADGGALYTEKDAFKVAACPPDFPFGTKIDVEGIGTVTCRDHGGAIKEGRLDIWAGIGMQALVDMKKYPGNYLRGTIIGEK